MGKNSFWEKFKADMYKKTVIKQLRKLLPPLPEETINAYEKLNKKEHNYISTERQKLVEEFNEAYTQSGLTAQELKSLIYTKYYVSEPADLTDQELAEFTQLLKEKGRGLLEAEVLISDKQHQELTDLFAEKQLNEDQERQVYLYLGMDPDKIPSQKEYEQIKEFVQSRTKEEILKVIGYEKKPVQASLEELEYM